MDCSSEERLIRMKLEELTNIHSLNFDVPGRTLEVYHTGGYDNLLAVIDSLQFDTTFVSSEPTDAVITEDLRGQEVLVL